MSLAAMRGGPGVLHVYHPLGYPAPGLDAAYLDAAVSAGAGVLELGLPFSDPTADGPVLQAASRQALQAGATTASSLAAVRAARRRHPEVGLVVMGYANLFHALGWEPAARALADAGADGAIVPDMPARESATFAGALRDAGVALVPLVTSTVTADTLRQFGGLAPPFVYVASLGTTGQAGPDEHALAALANVRQHAPGVPLAVGFGVRHPDDVRRLRAGGAHGVVVGSALVREVAGGSRPEAYGAHVRRLAEACR